MKWHIKHSTNLTWSGPIINREQKEDVARRIAELVKNGDVIGVGSGSIVFLALHEIAQKIMNEGIICTAIPTSAEMSLACAALGIPLTTLQQARPDWSFDGADEVDSHNNLIKGRGGALFQEKLVMKASLRTYIIVDKSKMVDHLGTKFPVPVETHPLAVRLVEEQLFKLGATEVNLRLAQKKDGPVITENGNFLFDVKFPSIESSLEKEIKSIPGVIESGLFIGYNPRIILPTGE